MKDIINFIGTNPGITLGVLATLIILTIIFAVLFSRKRNQEKVLRFKLRLIRTMVVFNPTPDLKDNIIKLINEATIYTVEDVISCFNEAVSHLSKSHDLEHELYESLRDSIVPLIANKLFEEMRDNQWTSKKVVEKLDELRSFGSFNSMYVGRELKDLVLDYIINRDDFDFNFLTTLKHIHGQSSYRSVINTFDKQKEIIQTVKSFGPKSTELSNLFTQINNEIFEDELKAREVLAEWIKREGKPKASSDALTA